MHDVRYVRDYARLRSCADPHAAISDMRHDEVVQALTAAAANGDGYLANVLASEATNRLRVPARSRAHGMRESGRTAGSMQAHDHACLVYETQEEQLATAVPYLTAGLARGEKCLYIGAEHEVEAVAERLRAEGVPVDEATESGRLAILTHRDAYLKNGRFDPDWMISFLKESTLAALDEGFEGLRVMGDMKWALGDDVGGEHILEYEAKLNTFFDAHPASAICQYDGTRFKPEVIVDVVHTHPRVIYGGTVSDNPYYVPPAEFLNPEDPKVHLDRLLENIVGRSRAEAALVELNDSLTRRVAERTSALSDANRELEAYLHTVSHDLRAPLRGIDQYARALEEDAGHVLDEDCQGHLARLRSESAHLSRLVTDLLKLSRATSGDLTRDELDLTRLARAIGSEFAAREPERNVTFTVHDGLHAKGDPRLVRTVLENLIGNAWKFTARTPDARITVGADATEDGPAFFVQDNGAGFDPARADRLFTLFERLHATTEFDGTGVGLASVQRIIRRHEGRVWAEGAPGKGATFHFTL